jgi:hypothetical protein
MTTAGLIIFALSFLIGGFLLGNLFPVFSEMIQGRDAGKDASDEEGEGDDEGDEADDEDEGQPGEEVGKDAEAGGEEAPKEKKPARAGLRPVANLWQDAESRKMVAEVDGKLISQAGQLVAQQHAQLSIALVGLQEWVGLESQMQKAEEAKTIRRQELFSRIEDRSAEAMEKQEEREEPPKPSGFKPVEILKSAVQAEYRVPPGFNKLSIPAQINEVLQEMLEGTSLEDRGIQLMDIPGRGMVVFVGLDTYGEIEDVPDLAIKTVIREAVKKWEKIVSNED